MKVLCIGDISLDTYSPSGKSFFGGCSLNVARQLGEKIGHAGTALYAPIGNDFNSKNAKKYLESLTLEMRLKILEGELPCQPISLNESGERELHDYKDGVLPEFTCEDLGKFFLSRFDMILFPYYKQTENMALSLLDLNPKASLACDFGNLSDYDGNLEVAKNFFDRLKYAQFSSEDTSAKRNEFFTKTSEEFDTVFVDTHGAMGASCYFRGHHLYCEAPNVFQVTDTTGAGDAFFAHFIHSYFIEERELKKSLEAACTGGSIQVGHLGPGPKLLN